MIDFVRLKSKTSLDQASDGLERRIRSEWEISRSILSTKRSNWTPSCSRFWSMFRFGGGPSWEPFWARGLADEDDDEEGRWRGRRSSGPWWWLNKLCWGFDFLAVQSTNWFNSINSSISLNRTCRPSSLVFNLIVRFNRLVVCGPPLGIPAEVSGDEGWGEGEDADDRPGWRPWVGLAFFDLIGVENRSSSWATFETCLGTDLEGSWKVLMIEAQGCLILDFSFGWNWCWSWSSCGWLNSSGFEGKCVNPQTIEVSSGSSPRWFDRSSGSSSSPGWLVLPLRTVNPGEEPKKAEKLNLSPSSSWFGRLTTLSPSLSISNGDCIKLGTGNFLALFQSNPVNHSWLFACSIPILPHPILWFLLHISDFKKFCKLFETGVLLILSSSFMPRSPSLSGVPE